MGQTYSTKKSKLLLGILFVAGTVVGLGYSYKKLSSKKNFKQNEQEKEPRQEFVKRGMPQATIETSSEHSLLAVDVERNEIQDDQNAYNEILQEKIPEQQVQQFIEWTTIKKIIEAIPSILREKYISLTLESRQKRRNLRLTQPQEYVRLILEYLESVEKNIELCTVSIYENMGISEQVYEDSIVNLIGQQGIMEEYQQIHQINLQKLKETIPFTQNLSQDIIIEMLNYQVQILDNPPLAMTYLIQQFSSDEQMGQLVPQAIQIIIQDLIFGKFKFEEEDAMQNFKNQCKNYNTYYYKETFEDNEIMNLLELLQIKMSYLFGQNDDQDFLL